MSDVGDCGFDGCENRATRLMNGVPLCEAHRKQMRLTGRLRPLKRLHTEGPRQRLVEAALAYADADSEDDETFMAARSNLFDAARCFAYGIVKSTAGGPGQWHRQWEQANVSNVLLFPRSSAPRPSLLAG